MFRAGLLAVAVVAVGASSAASAKDYEFEATDGTRCTVKTRPSAPLEPAGTVTLGWGTSARCNVAMTFILVSSHVTAEPDGFWGGDYPTFCNGRLPCSANTTYSHGGSSAGVAAQQFTHGGYVRLTLPASPTAVWSRVPVLDHSRDGETGQLDCLPGGRDVTCSLSEPISPGQG